MAQIKKIILEYDDKVVIFNGKEAEKYIKNFGIIEDVAQLQNVTPFESSPPIPEVYAKK